MIAIVGHGRSPEGKKWGRLIDACFPVIRMWDWSWQDKEDYGERYDFGLFEVENSMVKTFLANNKRQPALGWIASFLRESATPLPPDTEVVNQVQWTTIGRQLGGIGATGRLELTRGTIAACWAITKAWRRSEIVLVGFDNILLGKALPLDQAFSPEYRANPGTFPFDKYISGVSKYGNHDYAIEHPLLRHLAAKHSVTVSFAQHIW